MHVFCVSAGLSTASNKFMQEEMSAEAQQDLLLEYTDQLRLSMAGNLQDYQMENYKVLSHRYSFCFKIEWTKCISSARMQECLLCCCKIPFSSSFGTTSCLGTKQCFVGPDAHHCILTLSALLRGCGYVCLYLFVSF